MIEILFTETDDISIIDEPIVLLSLYKSPCAPLKQLFSDLDIIMIKIRIGSKCIITGDLL